MVADGMERYPPKKKAKRRNGTNNKQKRNHLLNIIKYAVGNFYSLASERDHRKLRAFAYALHCTPQGVRLRYEADFGENTLVSELVYAFQKLIMWRDLLTNEQFLAGNKKRKILEDAKIQAAEQVTGLPFLAHRVFYLLSINSIYQLY